jgi:hypothetical protein
VAAKSDAGDLQGNHEQKNEKKTGKENNFTWLHLFLHFKNLVFTI